MKNLTGEPLRKTRSTAVEWARYASAGGLTTTATDLSKFFIGLFSPKGNDPYRLGKNSPEEMFRPHVRLREEQKIDGASSWALGWAVRER